MYIDGTLSLEEMLSQHAQTLALENTSHRFLIQQKYAQRKIDRTDAKIQSKGRKATRELVGLRVEIGDGQRDIVDQSDVISAMVESGQNVSVEQDELVKSQAIQGFRKSHFVKLLNDQKNAADDD